LPTSSPTGSPPAPATVLNEVLRWSKAHGYKGYNKHDGLNSPILRLFLGWGKWPRLIAIQTVMRSPVNIRPMLLVRKSYNPKGLALFSQAWLDRYRVSRDPAHLAEAESLLGLLLELRSKGPWSGDCWGYQYIWQDMGFNAPAGTPNAVVTSFVCEAFLDAWRITGKAQYLEVVGRSIGFFLKDLRVLKDEPEELCLGYMPLPMTMRVMDVSILIASVLAGYGAASGDLSHAETARRLARYVVNRQTDYAAWFYTDPPGDSLIRHDNYHTGFILDALERYMAATGEREWQPAYDAGLKFYAEKLFNPDGSPRWMSDRDFPHDIHGAAQGIITFSRHRTEYPGLADRIVDWAIRRMYHAEGRFFYQETPRMIKRFTLMRWCNGWMSRALGVLLDSHQFLNRQ